MRWGNLPDFLGVFDFDKWTCNTNGRQAIFFRDPGGADGGVPAGGAPGLTTPPSAAPGYAGPGRTLLSDTAIGYTAMMIDFGFCFNAGEWNFPDAPLRGLYARHGVYERVAGMEAFEPWLDRLENRIYRARPRRRGRADSAGSVVRRRLGTRSSACSSASTAGGSACAN